MKFDQGKYGAIFAECLTPVRVAELGAGEIDRAACAKLERLDVAAAFAGRRVVDSDMAALCLAGVWLWHNDLDRSHAISQQIETPSGSFWHGIMHRREGDFSNAKYWFRRVGQHALYPDLLAAAQEIAAESPLAPSFRNAGSWDPFRFVDLVQAGTHESILRAIAQREWELLFDHCYHAAIGKP